MTKEQVIDEYVDEHKACRWMDAGELREVLTNFAKDLSPKWHKSTEHPKPDTEVLAEVKGFEHNRFAVLKWTKEGWWQHIPRMNDIMPSDGWIGTQGLFVIRWAYIDDRPQD